VGRRGYDPDMMLGLLLYSYAVGERPRAPRLVVRSPLTHKAQQPLVDLSPPPMWASRQL